MATQDQIEDAISPNGICCSAGSPQSEMLTQLQELYAFKHDQAPKVRKPYTITKQREKWTEEEHQKFLEALRLYGRGWRQIEEHIGTKTAVQIRSHAQKFFSKVVKESKVAFESSIKPIEIPPPRPKRKPLHPYPRKSVDSLKGVSSSHQPERSTSPVEQDNKSSASVLSTFVSDAMGSATSQQNGCSSPTSCTTNLQSINTSPVGKESDYVASNSSAEEEKACLPSFKIYGPSAVEEILSMNTITNLKDSTCATGDATTVVPLTSIKLLGKTIQVKDSSQTSKTGQEDDDAVSRMLVQALPSTCVPKMDTRLSLGTIVNESRTVPCGANLSSCMEIHQHKIDPVESPSGASLPWWAFYRGLPFYYISSFNQSNKVTSNEERMKEKESPNEKSCTGSNIGSVSQVENREKNSDCVDSLCQHLCSKGKVTQPKCSKGFVPYKRCLAERDVSSSVLVSEERERQRARVCS